MTYFKSKQTRNVGHARKSGREKEAVPEIVQEWNASISLVHLDDGRVRQHFDKPMKDCMTQLINLSHLALYLLPLRVFSVYFLFFEEFFVTYYFYFY